MGQELDLQLGRIALERGLITLEQLQESVQIRNERKISLEKVLLGKGYITRQQFQILRQHLTKQNRIGDYRLVQKVGEGGMGVVYRGVHIKSGEVRAIKVLNKMDEEDKEDIERFFREVRNSARINHPNVVRTYGGDREGKNFYFILEFVDGSSVEDMVESRGKITEKEALIICRSVALALEAARNLGIVHRDIKPENILITKEGKVKLADFGLAKSRSDVKITQTGYMVGTPAFISPEQATGNRDLDVRSDIYSLGITLFYMVTGEVPFDGKNPLLVCQKHVSEPLPDPKSFNPGLSDSTAELIHQMTAKKRSHRPRNPKELIELIGEAEKGELGKKKNISRRRLKNRKSKRRRRKSSSSLHWIILAIAVVLGLALIFIFAS